MFEEQLLNFYFKKISMWNLVYRYIWVNLLMFGLIFISSLGIGLFVLRFDFVSPLILLISIFIYIVLMSLCFGFIVIKPAISISKKKYNISFKSDHWRNFIYSILRSYLFQKEILVSDPVKDEKTLKFLINALKKRKEDAEKYSFLKVMANHMALFFLLWIPIWSGFHTWMYKNFALTWKDAVYYFIGCTGLVVFIVFSCWLPFRKNILEEISNRKSGKISYLIKALESINFSLENPNYNRAEKPIVIKQSIINEIIKEVEK
ncbi:hypothetical protein [Bacillus cereus]